jgi:desampylase
MVVTISSKLHALLLAYAQETPEEEICGLLFGDGANITDVQKMDNISSNPQAQFEIDPVGLIAAHRAARTGGPAIMGCFHSHPNGVCLPSVHDAEAAADDGSLWLIIANGNVGAWRTIHHGTVEGRFSPVTLKRTD